MRADSFGRPRWTVMVLGMTTAVSTRGAGCAPGVGPLPPPPAKRGWVGMTTGSSGGTAPSGAARATSGIISSRARVTCPAKICAPLIWTVRQPAFSAVMSQTA